MIMGACNIRGDICIHVIIQKLPKLSNTSEHPNTTAAPRQHYSCDTVKGGSTKCCGNKLEI